MRRALPLFLVTLCALPLSAQDLNGDGASDVLDLTAMVSHIQGVETLDDIEPADLDGDGAVTVRDVVLMLEPIHGCDADADCGPGFDCEEGRCFPQPHDHRLAPIPEEEPSNNGNNGNANNGADPTCCASTALQIARRATANGDGDLTVGPDYVDFTFSHACLSRTEDDPELVDRTWLQPARTQIARGLGTQYCDQIMLDDDASGERRIQGLSCETTLRFRMGDLSPADQSDTCGALVGVENPPDPDPDPDPQEECGGLPGCQVRTYEMVVPDIDEDYATTTLNELFPAKEVAAVEDGDVQVRLITADGSELTIQKADGGLLFTDAALNSGDAGDLGSEEAVAAADAFLAAHPAVFADVQDYVIKTATSPEFNAYVDPPRATSAQVSYALGLEASVDPDTPMTVPVVGWHLRINVDGDGTVTGLAATWAPSDLQGGLGLAEGPPLPVTTEAQVREQLGELGPFQHTGVLPSPAQLFYRRATGTPALDLGYVLDAHAPMVASSGHSHNLRTWWPATPGQLAVTLRAPRRSLELSDTFEIDGPIEFAAEATGGVPPYTYTWRLEDAAVGSRDRFPEDFPRPIVGQAIEMELYPNTRTEVRVLVEDSTGRRANDRVLVITGLDAPPGEVVEGGEDPAPPENPEPVENDGEYACPVPDPDDLIMKQTIGGFGWIASAEISDTDGLLLTNVRFQNSKLATRMDMPFYELTTARMEPTRCELGSQTSAPDKTCRSTLIEPGLRVSTDSGPFASSELTATTGTLRSLGRVEARACWCVENLGEADGAANDTLLYICHVFKFHAEGEGCSPDPAGVACAKWEPTIEYTYVTKEGRSAGFRKLKAFQRHDYDLDARIRQGDRPGTVVPILLTPNEVTSVVRSDGDIATFNQDYDDVRVVTPGLGVGPLPPLQTEGSSTMAVFSAPGQNDAHHQLAQTQGLYTSIVIPGCTLVINHLNGYQCHHSHWRWGAFIDEYFLFGDDTDIALGRDNTFGLTPGINGVLRLNGKAVIPPGSFGFGNVLIPSTQKATIHVVKFDPDEFESDPNTIAGDTFDPAGRTQEQAGIESLLRLGLGAVVDRLARGASTKLGFNGESAARIAGSGFNVLAEGFFEPFRLNVRGADLVTWIETESYNPGTLERPEILQKNSHHFFR